MWKISFVGHSQIPKHFSFPNTQVKIFRAPGATARTFFEKSSLNKVLEWDHDLTILWLGSNDINDHTSPETIFNDIQNIIHEIKVNCHSVVYICQVEPRIKPRHISPEHYKQIQGGINKRIKKRLNTPNIHFNNLRFVEELRDDGVHWNTAGRARVESKFKQVIKGFIGEDIHL